MTAHSVELRTARLVLRAFRVSDSGDVVAYASDPEWSRFILAPIPHPYTKADAESFIQSTMQDSTETGLQFAIVLGATVIGGVHLRIDRAARVGEVGYGLSRAHWGQGLTPEAAQAVVDWGFRTYELAEVLARHDVDNERSARVLEKIGMLRDGPAREETTGAKRRMVVTHRLSRGEWEGRLRPSTGSG